MSFLSRIRHRLRGRWWEAAAAALGALVLTGIISLSPRTHAREHLAVKTRTSVFQSQHTWASHWTPPRTLNLAMVSNRRRTAVAHVSTLHRDARSYTIRWGDTLWHLSRRFHVSIADLKSANGLKGDTIVAGARLVIPVVYRVKTGDTLDQIASRWSTSAHILASENNLSGSDLVPGTKLVIYPPPAHPRPKVHGAAQRPAVSAQPLASRGQWANPYGLTAGEVLMIAHLVQAEAGNQPFLGQVAVAAVVLNRLKSPHFPGTVSGVIFQPGQFETVSNGSYWNTPSALALMASKAAAAGWDPTAGALYFYNPAWTGSGWMTSLPTTVVIGAQVFAR